MGDERMIEIACNEYFSGPNFLIYFNSVIPSVLRKRGVNGGEISIFETTFITRGVKKKKRRKKGGTMGFLLKIINES